MNNNTTLTTVGAVTKTASCKTPANYYPCLREGKTSSVHIPAKMWDSMDWYMKSNGHNPNAVFIIVALRKEGNLDARISVLYDINTGRIITQCYQSNHSFDESSVFDLDTMVVEKRKQKLAGFAAQNLIKYFRDINALEYEKAKEERELRGFVDVADGVAAEFNDKTATSKKPRSKKTNKVYDPSSHKAPIYTDGKKSTSTRQYTVEKWERHGHYRHYANGKIVYIKPVTVYRRKEITVS